LFVLSFLFTLQFSYAKDFHFVVVDKGKHQIHVVRYNSNGHEILLTYHVTTGKVPGDKEKENDLKTPEGIYFFKFKSRPPTLKKKFGELAIYVDYPNPIDKQAGKTGYDIMLHATDDPSRLLRDLDSEGCVVVSNEQIKAIEKYIILNLTPMIIYSELKPEYLKENSNPEVISAFETWFKAWESKDIDKYIDSYVDAFSYRGMNKKQYKKYKEGLNKRYATIKVNPSNIRFFHHPKYEVIIFGQDYVSKFANGKIAFKSSGTKILYFVKQKDGRYKIAAEEFTNFKE